MAKLRSCAGGLLRFLRVGDNGQGYTRVYVVTKCLDYPLVLRA